MPESIYPRVTSSPRVFFGLLLVIFCVTLYYLFFYHSVPHHPSTNQPQVQGGGGGRLYRALPIPIPSLPSKSFQKLSSQWEKLEQLIIVPGHAIQWCTEFSKDIMDEECWYLMNYQRGQIPIFIEHIRQATRMAIENPKSLLVFSGGQTRPGIGPRSEAHSYFSIATLLGLLNGGSLFDRVVTEDFARDSLENLSFSICRFKQITSKYPKKVSVVGFPFKARRFIDLHRKAVKIPSNDFEYVSVQIPGYNQSTIIDDAYEDFKDDLYGCEPKLSNKRKERNPYNNQHGYLTCCPDMQHVLSKCD